MVLFRVAEVFVLFALLVAVCFWRAVVLARGEDVLVEVERLLLYLLRLDVEVLGEV